MLANIWVLSEKIAPLAELCGGAKAFGQKITALVIGTEAEAEKARTFGGADQVYLWHRMDKTLFEDYTAPLADLALQEKPDAIIVRGTWRARALAGRLAARLGTSVMGNIESCSLVEGKLRVESLMYGGGAIRAQSSAGISIIMVGGGFMKAVERSAAPASVKLMEQQPVPFGAVLVERRPRVGENVDLNAAKQVVGVGRGLGAKEDLRLITALAETLEAETACSRPVAEGENWMPRERYIGVSGAVIKPDIYWAIGISGQVQHTVGVTGAKTIVAVNKDKNAPIFKQCDYGIVGDLYKVVPILTELLKR